MQIRSRSNVTAITVVVLCCLTVSGQAVEWTEQAKLTASDCDNDDIFGGAVSLSGDYALVGSQFSHSAYIFHRDGTDWTQQAKLTGSGNDWFSEYLSLSGDYAIVGARGDDERGTSSGAAYIFHRQGTSWTQQVKLIASDTTAGDFFGRSVAIDGDYAVVGASRSDNHGSRSGSAYVFRRDGTIWTQQAKLTASDADAGDWFGETASLSGDYAIIGANRDADNGIDSGSAYVFHREGTSWTQQAKLTASDAAAEDQFGYSVSLSGDYALLGAFLDDDHGSKSGSAYIFHRDGTSWTQQAKLTASDAAAGDWFGDAVSLSGDYAIVGAERHDQFGRDSGTAYVFHREGTSWTQEAKLIGSGIGADDWFGGSVCLTDKYAILGAHGSNDCGLDSGSAYIFLVPEPSTLILLGMGAVGLLAYAWRRRR